MKERCVCAFMCVCERERERDFTLKECAKLPTVRERERANETTRVNR